MIRGSLSVAKLEADGWPIFSHVHDLCEREAALPFALKHMRENGEQAVFFIRQDGAHEVWDRGQLEKWAAGRPGL